MTVAVGAVGPAATGVEPVGGGAADDGGGALLPAVLDLRLVPAALAAWPAAWCVVLLPPRAAAVAAAAVLLGAGAVALPRRRRVRRGAPALGLALVVVAAVLGAGAAQVAVRDGVRAAAADGGSVTLTGRVAEEPAPLPPAWPGAPARVRLVLAVDTLAVDARAVDTLAVDAPTGTVPAGGAGDRGAHRVAAPVVVLAPASGPPVVHGARVRVTGRAVATGRGDDVAALVLAGAPPEAVAPPAAADRWAGRLREGVRRQAAPLGGDAGALLPGVAVGSTADVPEDLRAALRTSGLTHLTAVSGAHFSTVAALVLALAAAARVPLRARAGAALLAGTALLLVVHPVPSVVRAAAMGAVGVLGMLMGRPARAPAALAAAVVVLLVADPWRARDLGTALSVGATAAVVLLAPALVRRWAPVVGRGPATALAVPLAAQLVCGPLVVVIGGGVGLWAVPANLAAAPAVVPATVLGLLTAVLDPVSPPVAAVLAHAAGAACWWVAAVGRTAADLPGASVVWVPGTAGALLLAAAGTGAAGLLLHRR